MRISLLFLTRFPVPYLGLLILLSTSLLAQAQTIRYVKPTATGNGDGSSWTNASGNLQAIIINASVNASGVQQQVWVAAGTYKPTTTGDRNASFALWADVTVYGGFVGNEVSLSARPTINLTTPSSTTLSGEIGNPTSTTDNSYHVIRNSIGLAPTAILDGFVITGGNADGSSGSDNDKGGGILLRTNQQGQPASPLIRNCSFQANSATLGGAMFNGSSHINSQSSPTLINCSFQANTASGSGGAIFNRGVEASAGWGGGDSSPTLTNCIFLNNTASTGGAMYNNGHQGFGQSSPTLTNCSFQANTAGEGGAMYNVGSSGGRCAPTLTNCSFQANTASGGTTNRGGAIFNDGRYYSVSSPTLTNCSFQANTASYLGGAMYSMAYSNGESNAELTNCVLFNNGGANTFSNDGGYVYVNYSLLDASVTGYSNRRGRILSVSVSPFASSNNTTLATSSPAINTGDPGTTTATVGATDLAGNSRIVGCKVDMGAFEFQYVYLPLAINAQPATRSVVCAGTTVSVPVSVSGTVQGYQWYKDSFANPVAGQTTATLTLSSPQTGDAGSYSLVVTSTCNSLTSTAFSLTVNAVPIRLYVNASATTGANTGLSWSNAFTSLQSALTYSSCTQSLTEIWVAAGTYKPTTSTTDRNASFTLRNGVAIYGGFVGNETTLAARPAINPVGGPGGASQPSSTTLSGDINQDGQPIGNSYHVFSNSNINTTAMLDGFVITGGAADQKGGGMLNDASSPTIRNCVFQSNSASGSTNNQGGAMVNNSSSPTILNCVFLNNSVSGGTTSRGGAMHNTNSNPKLTNCVFLSNSVSGATSTFGGAMFNESNSNPQLTNCSFLSNSVSGGSSNLGGAMANTSNSSPQLTNCVVFGNGGGITFSNASSSITATYSLFDNTVTGYSSDPSNLTASTSPFASSTSAALAANSPAIDAGLSSTSGLSGILTDLAGNARIVGCRVDMGAVEFQDNTNQTLSITRQPASASAVCVGTSVTVPVSVSGTALAYQWYNGAGAISSQTSATLSLSNLQTSDAGSYWLTVSGTCNSLTSTAFSLTVSALPTLTITASPSATVTQGNPLTLTLSNTGATSFTWNTGSSSSFIVLNPTTSATYSATARSGAGCVASASLAITVTAPACNPVIFVTQLGDGLRDGSSWSNALSNNQLQIAINAAANCGGTGQVWVAAGLYKPTSNTDRNASFAFRNGVAIYGGFVGNETTLTARPAINPVAGSGGAAQPSSTTLSGDIGTVGNSTDNSFHVINNPASLSLTTTAVLDGFVITGGAGSAQGGGMLNVASSPTIRNCSFLNNSASGSGTNQGGAMANATNSSPQLTNCSFLSNSVSGGTTNQGGAMFNTNSSPQLINCSFLSNSVSGGPTNQGGAIFNTSNSSPQLTNCSFLSNSVSSGTSQGGAMFNTTNSSPQLTNCSFLSNSVSGNSSSKRGGAMFNESNSSPKVTNCVFLSNSASGSGINYGGAIANNSSSGPQLINCVFLSNSASGGTNNQGGAISNTNSSPKLTNCSFQGNTTSINRGWVMDNTSSNPQLINCVVFGNGGGSTFYNLGSSSITATYSLFDNTVTGYSSDPSNLTATISPFVSSTSVALNACTSAINAGLNSATGLAGITTDLAGNPRFYQNGPVDMGAYEYQATPGLILTNPSLTTATQGIPFSGTFSATGGTTPYSFSLDSGTLPTGLTLLTTGILSGTPTQTGSFSITIRVTDATGCSGSGTPYVLTVSEDAPILTGFSVSPGTVCAGSPVNFTASIGNVSGSYAYTLTNGSNTLSSTSSTAFSQSLTAAESGNQSFTLIISSNGKSTTATTNLLVNALPTANLQASGTLTCTTTRVTLTASGGATYSFSGPGLVSQNPVSGTAVANASGLYSVSITSAAGCSATATTSVSSNTTPPTATILTPASTTLTCTTTSISLTATGGGTYRWDNTSTNAVRSVTTEGIYSLTVTAPNGCTALTTQTIATDTAPPSVSIAQSSATLSCTTSSVSLSAVGSGTYRWSTGATTASISVSVAGTYSLTLTGPNGCLATASISVSYQNCPPTVANAIPSVSATVGTTFSYTIPANTFTDAETPNSLTLSVAGLPAGLSFVSPTTLTGVPSTTVGSPFAITVVAVDGSGGSVSTVFWLNVVNSTGCGNMYTLKSGTWNDGSVWSCGRVPVSTDVVTLHHTVSLPASYQGQALRVMYSPGSRLVLSANSRLRLGGN